MISNTTPDLDRTVAERPHVKVCIPLDYGDSDGPATENLWAEQFEGGLYRLDNVPCFADQYHYHDVVRCDASDPDDYPRVLYVVVPSQHDTFHLEINPSESRDQDVHRAHTRQVRERLTERFPVHCEHGFDWLHVDVPPGDFRHAFIDLLDQLAAEGLISGVSDGDQ